MRQSCFLLMLYDVSGNTLDQAEIDLKCITMKLSSLLTGEPSARAS